ncbi:hypothetical protein AYJ57_07305 [Salipiger sp. CCB-MM3]|uniref:hypothetical protein n=1 Tax=Salipiger sp. CCB-MM3 TaxID=1792508 RepID=UPI00080A9E33|nr:hypothetical protein [Salipiger sp. CCB-MM3]ANT60188.1 hypothetical protein AYJ57_07305 [Salipiger sp. CCB-MM3]
MEPTYDIVPSSWRAGGMGNGVQSLNLEFAQAHDLALVDAGIAVGSFGYGMTDPRDAARLTLMPETEAEQFYGLEYDALAHERAELTTGRKSKLALFRLEADGSVRGLRNAAISLGYMPDRNEAGDDKDSHGATDQGGYGESWRIGWTERLPEIMQLSVDGPLEDMGLDATGHVPRAPVEDPLSPSASVLSTEAGTEMLAASTAPTFSAAARDLMLRFLDEDADEPDTFDFSGAAGGRNGVQTASGPAAQSDTEQTHSEMMAQELQFIESQYAALHGALFDGDSPVDFGAHHGQFDGTSDAHAPEAAHHGVSWLDWLHSDVGGGFA